jgi:hypothetical protein
MEEAEKLQRRSQLLMLFWRSSGMARMSCLHLFIVFSSENC